MALAAVTLNDKYTVESGRIFLTGTQALVRLPMMQRARDVAAGLNTACFISGYRGSPLGGFDQGLWSPQRFLAENHLKFHPDVNHDLRPTPPCDSQPLGLFCASHLGMPWCGLPTPGPTHHLAREFRRHKSKLCAALAFARANKLDKIVLDSPKAGIGIVTTGKSYLDVRQAFDDLGIDEAHAAEIGIRLYKVAMSWPLEREGIRHFAHGLDEILLIAENRAVIENQFKEQLYNWREDVRPRVVGKFDENRNWIMPSTGELTPAQIARVIAQRIGRFYTSPRIEDRLKFLAAKEQQLPTHALKIHRPPHSFPCFPHNTPTHVPHA